MRSIIIGVLFVGGLIIASFEAPTDLEQIVISGSGITLMIVALVLKLTRK